MTQDDLAPLLRIKQAREQRAEAALRQAQAAQLRAVKARGRAAQAEADFATERQAQEAAIYRTLSAGPIPSQRLRQTAAQLSGIAAYASVLGQRAAQAARHETACAETSEAARRAHAAALRDTLGVVTLHQQLDTAARAATEQGQDAELEEASAHCEPALPGWSRS